MDESSGSSSLNPLTPSQLGLKPLSPKQVWANLLRQWPTPTSKPSVSSNVYRAEVDATLIPSTIRGYRTWGHADIDGQLPSVVKAATWVPGMNEAVCIAPYDVRSYYEGHLEVPDPKCSCGFYSWHTEFPPEYLDKATFGVIEASGRIVLGTHGMRSQRAKVIALAPHHDYANFKSMELAAARFGVPYFQTPEEMFEAFPPDDLSALFPPPGQKVKRSLDDMASALGDVTSSMKKMSDAVARFDDALKAWHDSWVQYDQVFVSSTFDPTLSQWQRPMPHCGCSMCYRATRTRAFRNWWPRRLRPEELILASQGELHRPRSPRYRFIV